jgi:hypothetical protein
MKYSRCDKCFKENLVWAQSKKGNWYLSDPKIVTTKTHGKFLTIPFAHRCDEIPPYEAGFTNGRNESFLHNLVMRSGA